MKIKVKCPAKINLTLKVFKKDELTGFHPIESIMQSVSLFDYLTVENNNEGVIKLSGNSNEILYDENNLVYKAVNAYFEKAKIKNEGINIYIEKNIPVASGLAGGSADCAGTIFALNYIYNKLDKNDIIEINSKLGSDINFCYFGGKASAKGKGDDLTFLEFEPFRLSIIKPKELKISTKDAYGAYDELNKKSTYENDLEFAMVLKYPELKKLHDLGFQMSGSGPSFFIKKDKIDNIADRQNYEIYENLSAVDFGVSLIK